MDHSIENSFDINIKSAILKNSLKTKEYDQNSLEIIQSLV